MHKPLCTSYYFASSYESKLLLASAAFCSHEPKLLLASAAFCSHESKLPSQDATSNCQNPPAKSHRLSNLGVSR